MDYTTPCGWVCNILHYVVQQNRYMYIYMYRYTTFWTSASADSPTIVVIIIIIYSYLSRYIPTDLSVFLQGALTKYIIYAFSIAYPLWQVHSTRRTCSYVHLFSLLFLYIHVYMCTCIHVFRLLDVRKSPRQALIRLWGFPEYIYNNARWYLHCIECCVLPECIWDIKAAR